MNEGFKKLYDEDAQRRINQKIGEVSNRYLERGVILLIICLILIIGFAFGSPDGKYSKIIGGLSIVILILVSITYYNVRRTNASMLFYLDQSIKKRQTIIDIVKKFPEAQQYLA